MLGVRNLSLKSRSDNCRSTGQGLSKLLIELSEQAPVLKVSKLLEIPSSQGVEDSLVGFPRRKGKAGSGCSSNDRNHNTGTVLVKEQRSAVSAVQWTGISKSRETCDHSCVVHVRNLPPITSQHASHPASSHLPSLMSAPFVPNVLD